MALQHFRSLDGISLVSDAQRVLALIVPAGSHFVAPDALGLRVAERSYVAIERKPLALPVGPVVEHGCAGLIVNGVDRRHEAPERNPLPWVYHDGGRFDAGFRGETGDCVTRAIAIATKLPYHEVYDAINRQATVQAISCGHRKSHRPSSARAGVSREVSDDVLRRLGWQWVPTMSIGSGCTVHLRAGELPAGRLIVRLSKHVTAVIDGVVFDTHDPGRGGDRCVYGYYQKG